MPYQRIRERALRKMRTVLHRPEVLLRLLLEAIVLVINKAYGKLFLHAKLARCKLMTRAYSPIERSILNLLARDDIAQESL